MVVTGSIGVSDESLSSESEVALGQSKMKKGEWSRMMRLARPVTLSPSAAEFPEKEQNEGERPIGSIT